MKQPLQVTLRALGLGLMFFSSCSSDCGNGSTSTASSVSAPSSSSPAPLSLRGPWVDRDDLARWASTDGALGLSCLDDWIRDALRKTADQPPTPEQKDKTRNQLFLNPPPEQLETNRNALAIYSIEMGDETDRLAWLRGAAMVLVTLPRIQERVPVIVVDRNLLRWMGTRVEKLIRATRIAMVEMRDQLQSPRRPDAHSIDDLVRAFVSREDGGFGTPLRFTSAPEAMGRYCSHDPSGEDLLVLHLLLAETLWTLRHEMHHVWTWKPDPKRSDPKQSEPRCPTIEEITNAPKSEIEADKFAADALENDNFNDFFAPWKDRVDDWIKSYGDPTTTLDVKTRLATIAFLVSHHELATTSGKQIWIARGRYQAMSRRAGEQEDDSADVFDLVRVLKTSGKCPSKTAMEEQCQQCSGNPGDCNKAIETYWACAPILVADEKVAREQDALWQAAVDHLQKRGFSVRKHPEATDSLHIYLVERAGVAPAVVGYVRGIRLPAETEDFTELQRQALFRQGGPRHIGGLLVMADRSYVGLFDAQPVVDTLLEWETRRHRDGCQPGDAPACRWLGFAYFNGRGTRLDYRAAYLAYDKACEGGINAGCSRKKQLRELLSQACLDGDRILCAEWGKVFPAEPPPRPAKQPR